MPVAQKSAISFALVHIPVELFLATQDNDIHFNQLTGDMKRVRYRKTGGADHELKRRYRAGLPVRKRPLRHYHG